MKKMLLIFVFLNSVICGQQNIKNFYPLRIGNKWVYLHSWSSFGGGGSRIEAWQLTRDTTAYGRQYFWSSNNNWVRVDSLTGSLYQLDKNGSCPFYDHELIIDSLRAGLNDSTKNCLTPQNRPKCTDTSYYEIFGGLRQRKKFQVNCSVAGYSCSRTRVYTDSLGITFSIESGYASHNSWSDMWEMRGCVVNGKAYGDTSIPIGIFHQSNEMPYDYALSQNYPNPFNPITKIKFDIPKLSFTKLIIYDLLGREMALLVNEELKPGSYEAEWDASNYSSGIYIYQLIADKFVETKKMVLTK